MRAASVIGIALVLAGAICPSAQADVIWSGTIDFPVAWTPGPPYSPEFPPIALNLDLNKDGLGDFWFGDIDDYTPLNFVATCNGDNAIANGSAPLPAGYSLDASTSWGGGVYTLDQWLVLYGQEIGGAGTWHGVTGYMGLQFEAADGTHYGWVNMTVYDEFPGMTIHDWAYESTPGTGIVAGAVPEPSSAILAILGAITAWNLRRCRQWSPNALERP